MNTINILGNSLAIVFIIMASISYYTERDLWKVNAMIWSITSMIYMNLYYRNR